MKPENSGRSYIHPYHVRQARAPFARSDEEQPHHMCCDGGSRWVLLQLAVRGRARSDRRRAIRREPSLPSCQPATLSRRAETIDAFWKATAGLRCLAHERRATCERMSERVVRPETELIVVSFGTLSVPGHGKMSREGRLFHRHRPRAATNRHAPPKGAEGTHQIA